MTRSTRSDSKAGAKIAVDSALAGPLDPPAHVRLREGDRPFWDAIVSARARNRWDDADLAIAANLARTEADIETLQERLDREGHVIENQKGTPIANPLHAILETLTRRAVALSRMLHVHPEAKDGESRDQGKKLGKQRQAGQSIQTAVDVAGDLGNDALLGGRAKPH